MGEFSQSHKNTLGLLALELMNSSDRGSLELDYHCRIVSESEYDRVRLNEAMVEFVRHHHVVCDVDSRASFGVEYVSGITPYTISIEIDGVVVASTPMTGEESALLSTIAGLIQAYFDGIPETAFVRVSGSNVVIDAPYARNGQKITYSITGGSSDSSAELVRVVNFDGGWPSGSIVPLKASYMGTLCKLIDILQGIFIKNCCDDLFYLRGAAMRLEYCPSQFSNPSMNTVVSFAAGTGVGVTLEGSTNGAEELLSGNEPDSLYYAQWQIFDSSIGPSDPIYVLRIAFNDDASQSGSWEYLYGSQDFAHFQANFLPSITGTGFSWQVNLSLQSVWASDTVGIQGQIFDVECGTSSNGSYKYVSVSSPVASFTWLYTDIGTVSATSTSDQGTCSAAGLSYEWVLYDTDGTTELATSALASPVFNVITQGFVDYPLKLTVTNNCGLSSTVTQNVQAPISPVISLQGSSTAPPDATYVGSELNKGDFDFSIDVLDVDGLAMASGDGFIQLTLKAGATTILGPTNLNFGDDFSTLSGWHASGASGTITINKRSIAQDRPGLIGGEGYPDEATVVSAYTLEATVYSTSEPTTFQGNTVSMNIPIASINGNILDPTYLAWDETLKRLYVACSSTPGENRIVELYMDSPKSVSSLRFVYDTGSDKVYEIGTIFDNVNGDGRPSIWVGGQNIPGRILEPQNPTDVLDNTTYYNLSSLSFEPSSVNTARYGIKDMDINLPSTGSVKGKVASRGSSSKIFWIYWDGSAWQDTPEISSSYYVSSDHVNIQYDSGLGYVFSVGVSPNNGLGVWYINTADLTNPSGWAGYDWVFRVIVGDHLNAYPSTPYTLGTGETARIGTISSFVIDNSVITNGWPDIYLSASNAIYRARRNRNDYPNIGPQGDDVNKDFDITHIAGLMNTPGDTNGAGTSARFQNISRLEVDRSNGVLYVAQAAGYPLRWVDLSDNTVGEFSEVDFSTLRSIEETVGF